MTPGDHRERGSDDAQDQPEQHDPVVELSLEQAVTWGLDNNLDIEEQSHLPGEGKPEPKSSAPRDVAQGNEVHVADGPSPLAPPVPDDAVPGSKWVVGPDNQWLLLPPDLQDPGGGVEEGSRLFGDPNAGGRLDEPGFIPVRSDPGLSRGSGILPGRGTISQPVTIVPGGALAGPESEVAGPDRSWSVPWLLVGVAVVAGAVVAVLALAGVFSAKDEGAAVGSPTVASAIVTAATQTGGTAAVQDTVTVVEPPAVTTEVTGQLAAPADTYHLQMSNGEQFPIYRFVIGGAAPQLGIVLRPPDTCWVLQWGPGDAALDGTCTTLVIGGNPAVASRLLTGEGRYVVALSDSGQLALGDELGNQGVEADLAGQTIATVVVDGPIEIGGETFTTG